MSEKTEWKELSINFTIKNIGAPLITNLAQGLYPAPAVVREYIQNAVDSYVEFARAIGEKPSNEGRVKQFRGFRIRVYLVQQSS